MTFDEIADFFATKLVDDGFGIRESSDKAESVALLLNQGDARGDDAKQRHAAMELGSLLIAFAERPQVGEPEDEANA